MKSIRLKVLTILSIVGISLVMFLNSLGTVNAQTGGTKLCSAVEPGNFRDTISVSSAWSAGTCQNYANSVRAQQYQLGCTFSNAFSWGSANGGTPNPNCGW